MKLQALFEGEERRAFLDFQQHAIDQGCDIGSVKYGKTGKIKFTMTLKHGMKFDCSLWVMPPEKYRLENDDQIIRYKIGSSVDQYILSKTVRHFTENVNGATNFQRSIASAIAYKVVKDLKAQGHSLPHNTGFMNGQISDLWYAYEHDGTVPVLGKVPVLDSSDLKRWRSATLLNGDPVSTVLKHGFGVGPWNRNTGDILLMPHKPK